jgi:hypothetical protein
VEHSTLVNKEAETLGNRSNNSSPEHRILPFHMEPDIFHPLKKLRLGVCMQTIRQLLIQLGILQESSEIIISS